MDVSPWAELLALSITSLNLALLKKHVKRQEKQQEQHDQLRFDASAMDKRLSDNVRDLKQELRECHRDRDAAIDRRDEVERQNRELTRENLELARAERNRRRRRGEPEQ